MRKHSDLLKERAIKLRKSGLSYNEIHHQLPLSKSTLSLWLKSIKLKPEHQKRLYTKQIAILSLGSQSQKERREREVKRIIESAKNEIELPIDNSTYRMMGAALYWAEGSKGKNFNITNSDPNLVLFIVKWLEKIFDIQPRNLKARLNIYPQQNEKKIKKFWSSLTDIPVASFGKSFVKPISKGYKKNNLYYGTIRIEVPKGTDMRHRVYGWIQAALQDISPQVQLTQRRWIALSKVVRPVNLNLE